MWELGGDLTCHVVLGVETDMSRMTNPHPSLGHMGGVGLDTDWRIIHLSVCDSGRSQEAIQLRLKTSSLCKATARH